MRRQIVAGNWKMNGDTSFAKAFAAGLKDGLSGVAIKCDVMIAPPSPLISTLTESLQGSAISLASQNVAAYENGAYTGEVSALMLKGLGCGASLVGHSERRTLFGETDAQVAIKVERLVEQGLEPVLCVGETLDERDAGRAQEVVTNQVVSVLNHLPVEKLSKLVIAYEPVWAIGTGRTATPEQAQGMHAHIRAVVANMDAALAENITILYGGSVNSKTAQELFAQPDIDGGLVGGASLKIEEFLSICQSF